MTIEHWVAVASPPQSREQKQAWRGRWVGESAADSYLLQLVGRTPLSRCTRIIYLLDTFSRYCGTTLAFYLIKSLPHGPFTADLGPLHIRLTITQSDLDRRHDNILLLGVPQQHFEVVTSSHGWLFSVLLITVLSRHAKVIDRSWQLAWRTLGCEACIAISSFIILYIPDNIIHHFGFLFLLYATASQ